MSSDKSWTVVKFEDNTVEAVPTGWLIGNMCYWPPFSQEKINHAIRKSEMVNTCWPTFKVEFFKGAIFDDYISARLKAKKAEATSDLNSGTEGLDGSKKIRNRKPRLLTSSDSSGDESLLPLPPKIRKESTIKTVSKCKDVTKTSHIRKYAEHEPENQIDMRSTLTSSSRIDTPIRSQHTSKNDIFGENKVSDDQITIASKSKFTIDEQADDDDDLSFSRNIRGTNSSVVASRCNNSCPQCCMTHLKTDDKSFKQLTSQNHVLRSMVSEILDEVHLVHDLVKKSFNENYGKNEKSSIFLKYHSNIKFPIDTIEEMQQFEEFMKNEEDFSEAVNEMSKYGGTNNYNFVKRILTLLISNALATKYSWLGRKGKMPFNLLAMSKIIIGAADKAGLAPSYKSTENSIQLWLKRSSGRVNADQNKRV